MVGPTARTVTVFLVLARVGAAATLTEQQIAAGAQRAGRGLQATTRRLAAARLGGRDNSTPESDQAQHLLVRQLRRLGVGLVAGARGFDAYRQPFTQSGQAGANVVAVIRGRELPDEFVMLGAHYDHFGTHSDAAGDCASRFPAGGTICNGATDNANGVSVVLAVGRGIAKLPHPPRRSVVLALWDAEEDGLLGSLYYVNHPLVPLAATRAYLNFDIQGSDLLPSLDKSTFAVGGETGGSALQAFVAAADAADDALEVRPVSYIFGQGRSDYANFVAHGVPTVFLGDGTNGCYHTVDDDIGIVDGRKLAAQGRLAYRLAMALVEAPDPPPFRPTNPALAVYADAVALDAVFTDGFADLSLFPPADQTVIEQTQRDIGDIVAGGPARFDGADISLLFTAATQGIDAIQRLGCLRRR